MPRRLSSVICILLLISACSLRSNGSTAPIGSEDYFQLSEDKRNKIILTYPIEKQIDIYIFSVQVIHPPRLEIAYEIARQGEKIIPYLMSRLSNSHKENTQRDLIYIFEMMRSHGFKLNKNTELISLLSNTILSMKINSYKETAKKSLDIIMN